MNLGLGIKQVRKICGLTQKELSTIIGVSATSISLAEKGVKNPRRATIQSICDFAKVPQSFIYLLSLEQDDVHNDKRELFIIAVQPVLKQLIKQFIESD